MNSIRTPRPGTTDYTRRIAEAVDDEGWQQYRVSMKGKPTAEKLLALREYWLDELDKAQYILDEARKMKRIEDIQIRIDNYIKALSRGGQLYPGESLASAVHYDWKLRIKK